VGARIGDPRDLLLLEDRSIPVRWRTGWSSCCHLQGNGLVCCCAEEALMSLERGTGRTEERGHEVSRGKTNVDNTILTILSWDV